MNRYFGIRQITIAIPVLDPDFFRDGWELLYAIGTARFTGWAFFFIAGICVGMLVV